MTKIRVLYAPIGTVLKTGDERDAEIGTDGQAAVPVRVITVALQKGEYQVIEDSE